MACCCTLSVETGREPSIYPFVCFQKSRCLTFSSLRLCLFAGFEDFLSCPTGAVPESAALPLLPAVLPGETPRGGSGRPRWLAAPAQPLSAQPRLPFERQRPGVLQTGPFPWILAGDKGLKFSTFQALNLFTATGFTSPPQKKSQKSHDDPQNSQDEVFTSSPSLVRKKAIRNKVLRSGAYRSFTFTPLKQRNVQERLNASQGGPGVHRALSRVRELLR